MKIKLLVITGSFLFGLISGQVGVNTISPQQALHISGSGNGTSQPIARIDGLNNTNNPAHENSASVKRVFVGKNGDLVILNNDHMNKFNRQTTSPGTIVPAGGEISGATMSFTLDYPSLVHFESWVGMSIAEAITGAAAAGLKNEQARLFGSYFKLTTAPSGVASNTAFGHAYLSHSTANSGDQLLGVYYMQPRKDLYLPKGSYTVGLFGQSVSSDMRFSIDSARLIVSATPVNY